MPLEQIIELIQKRDRLPYHEAREQVMVCADMIDDAIISGCSLDYIEDILLQTLGLEPDYLEFFL